MFTGNAKSYLLNLVIVRLDIEINVWYKMLLWVLFTTLKHLNICHVNGFSICFAIFMPMSALKPHRDLNTLCNCKSLNIHWNLKEHHVITVTTQSLWMTPWVSIPPNTNAKWIVFVATWLLTSSSSSHTVQGNKHMEWSRRLGGISPSNFKRTHLRLTASRKYNSVSSSIEGL